MADVRFYYDNPPDGGSSWLIIPFIPSEEFNVHWETIGMNSNGWSVGVEVETNKAYIRNEGEEVDCHLSETESEYVDDILKTCGYQRVARREIMAHLTVK